MEGRGPTGPFHIPRRYDPELRVNDAPMSHSRPAEDGVNRSPSYIRGFQDGAQDGDRQGKKENFQLVFGVGISARTEAAFKSFISFVNEFNFPNTA